jgi:TMEM199 family protein
MARLRREEEARSYERMTNPPPPMETFAQRFPASSAAHAFASNHYPAGPSDPFAENDEVTYADVDRQMALIFNIFLSIVACAAAIWVAARWWSTPARLALSMSGSMLVGVAEVVVYSGYIRRVGDAKVKEKSVKEIKKVMKTWVVGSVEEGTNDGEKPIVVKSKDKLDDSRTRKRKKEIS